MNPTRVLTASAGVVLAVVAAWAWLRPVVPVDTPHFRWQQGQDERYQLVVSDMAADPAFRQGMTTTPVPQSGTLRVVGTAQAGAIVEVSNPATNRFFQATADATGAFAIDAEVRRGDTLKLLSRRIEFRGVQQPRYSSAVESNP
ncbi:MAG: Ig-like domain-containing protein [Arenimonas sp.]